MKTNLGSVVGYYKHFNGFRTCFKHLQNSLSRFTVVYIHGYESSKTGTKSQFIENVCLVNDIDFFAMDLLGKGESDPDPYTQGHTLISTWTNQIRELLHQYLLPKSQKQLIFVSSSLGAYLNILLLRDNATIVSRSKAAILLCPAIDFPIMVYRLLSEEGVKQFEEEGKVECPLGEESSFFLDKSLLTDAQKLSILTGPTLDYSIDVSLIWGSKDRVVPFGLSEALLDKVDTSVKNRWKLIRREGSEHRMNTDSDLKEIEKEILTHSDQCLN